MPFDPDALSPRSRQRHFTIAVGAAFSLVLLRLFTMQVLQGPKYRELSEENRIRVEVIAAPRGEIRDRNGTLLADNVPWLALLVFSDGELIGPAAKRADLSGRYAKRAKQLSATITLETRDLSRDDVSIFIDDGLVILVENRRDAAGECIRSAKV